MLYCSACYKLTLEERRSLPVQNLNNGQNNLVALYSKINLNKKQCVSGKKKAKQPEPKA